MTRMSSLTTFTRKQVVSPFQAILDYEKSHGIPLGWINHAISASAPHGSWQKLERGEIPLDAAFFRQFHADLINEGVWKAFHLRRAVEQEKKKKAKGRGESPEQASTSVSQLAEEALFNAPPIPTIDAEWLFWEMMRVSRAPDPYMYPALQRLRQLANASIKTTDKQGNQATAPGAPFLVAALSNTSIFPADHEFNDHSTPAGQFTSALRALFDLFVSSAHVGMRKPDANIYEYTITQLDALARAKGLGGVRAADIVFLDDIGMNLRTARAVGMRTVKVTLGRADLAVRELEAIMGVSLSNLTAKL